MTPYATLDDLTAMLTDLGQPVPAGANGLLLRASRMVRRATITAIYDTDDDGNPTSTKIVDALRDATCEQVASWGTVDSNGSPTVHQTVSAGRISLGWVQGTSGASIADGEQLSPQAVLILQDACLVGTGPWQP
jgi:hypothetical protein